MEDGRQTQHTLCALPFWPMTFVWLSSRKCCLVKDQNNIVWRWTTCWPYQAMPCYYATAGPEGLLPWHLKCMIFLYFCNCISMLLGCGWTLWGLVPVGNVVGMFWGTWHSYNCWCSLAGLAKKVTEIQMGIQKYMMGSHSSIGTFRIFIGTASVEANNVKSWTIKTSF